MTRPAMAPPDRALLIGIDRYVPDPDASLTYPCLAGATRDAERMETFLRGLGLASHRIARLTAPSEGPLPPAERLPTYENLVAALKRLSAVARSGEQVFVFYAGHGGRVATAFPELKGDEGRDEALVPWNVGDPRGRYLRDVELACLVHRMVERGLYLTLFLDCCHSGSALRRDDNQPIAARELGRIDPRPAEATSLAGSRDELLMRWRRQYDPAVAAPSGWLPGPRGYVLLAACEEHEKALEYAFDGEHRQGVLSRALLDALAPRSRITYRQLYEQVCAAVRSAFTSQTPQLEGDEDRFVFEPVRRTRRRGVAVLRVDPASRRVLLHTGEAQGIRPGARFVVTAGDPSASGPATADVVPVEVCRSGSTLSWARVVGDPPAGGLRPAALASLTALPVPLRVALRGPDTGTAAVAGALAREAGGFAVAADLEAGCDLRLAIDARGRIELQDERGQRLPNQGPPLDVGGASFAAELGERLSHLARYQALRTLLAPPPSALLSGKLGVRLREGGSDEAGGRGLPLSPDGELPLRTGQVLRFELRNLARQPLYLVILSLRPDWSIVQLYPPPGLGRACLPLGPGLPLSWTFSRSPTPGAEPGCEEIRAFATVGASDFRWLELPPLDFRLRTHRSPVATPLSTLRALEPEAVAERGWTAWRLRLRADPPAES